VLIGESHTGHKQKFVPIIRSGNGKFFGFGEPEAPTLDEMQGRFAQLLPTKIPDPPTGELAKAMLKVKGVGRAMPATTPPTRMSLSDVAPTTQTATRTQIATKIKSPKNPVVS